MVHHHNITLWCDVQARAAVAGLLLVAPYVCHWRNVTLQRRCQAQAAGRMAPGHRLHAFGHDHSYTSRAESAQMYPEVSHTRVSTQRVECKSERCAGCGMLSLMPTLWSSSVKLVSGSKQLLWNTCSVGVPYHPMCSQWA